MCGIAGILAPLPPDEVRRRIQSMLDAQVHRGPDDEGVAVVVQPKAALGLGSRRLAILDLSPLGHQPMHDPDTGHVLVYNGEIYNSPELREELEGRGHTFRGRSDTEVLLRAYETWGIDCFERLRGMFAAALWDARRQRLLLARDHLGIKPLYYGRSPSGAVVWASEVRAALASGLIPFRVDPRGLVGYLAYGAAQEPLTIVEGLRMVAPGTRVELDAWGHEVSTRSYWTLPQPDAGPAARDLIESGQALLERGVTRHLLSDVPLGVFLSSGLDSTAVAGLANRAGGVHSFTVSFPDDPDFDEGPRAREIAQRLGTTHHECRVDLETATNWTQRFLERMDQPTMDGLNTYIVSRAVRDAGIVVALSGQGGDEIFGGYRTFFGVQRWLRGLRIARWLAPSARARLARLAASPLDRVMREKLGDMARIGDDFMGLFFQYRRLLSDGDLAALLLAGLPAGLDRTLLPEEARPSRHLIPGDPAASVRLLETDFYLRNVLLRDGDVFGMANSMEIRVPFLDRDVIDWALRLPGAVFLPGMQSKPLLRSLCRDFYDAAQLGMPKRGFTPPLSIWMRGPLRDLVESSLRQLEDVDLLRRSGIERVTRAFFKEPKSAAWSRLWALVVLGVCLGRLGTGDRTVAEAS
jgi:asparagine synthase (glutamine-hydrolysing)